MSSVNSTADAAPSYTEVDLHPPNDQLAELSLEPENIPTTLNLIYDIYILDFFQQSRSNTLVADKLKSLAKYFTNSINQNITGNYSAPTIQQRVPKFKVKYDPDTTTTDFFPEIDENFKKSKFVIFCCSKTDDFSILAELHEKTCFTQLSKIAIVTFDLLNDEDFEDEKISQDPVLKNKKIFDFVDFEDDLELNSTLNLEKKKALCRHILDAIGQSPASRPFHF